MKKTTLLALMALVILTACGDGGDKQAQIR